jgi:hypothetical protein
MRAPALAASPPANRIAAHRIGALQPLREAFHGIDLGFRLDPKARNVVLISVGE